jgi:hypothetical protein
MNKEWKSTGEDWKKQHLRRRTWEDGGRAEGSDRESDDEKGGDSKGVKRAGSKNGWWDRGCEHLKKEAVKALRAWRRNKMDRSRFLEAKRRYRERERCREKNKQRGKGRRKR